MRACAHACKHVCDLFFYSLLTIKNTAGQCSLLSPWEKIPPPPPPPPPPPTVCTNSKTNNNNENKNKSYPFQDVLLVLSVVHEECHLPAGVAVEGVEFLASRVVWKVAVTGVQRLASIHWVQDHLVSNHNLNTHRNRIQTNQNSQTIPASYTVLTSCNSLPSS